jgi:hypothetical protein
MEWCSVVGEVLGNHSVPLDIIGEELLVATETPLIASRLSMMGGNVTRVLAEKWGLKVKKIKVTVGRLPLKNLRTLGSRSSRPFLVEVSEDEVAELERDYLQRFPDLPEDVALSLARLQAFFTKRFSKGRQ